MYRPRWLRSDPSPRLREEKEVEDMDPNTPRVSRGSYRLREEKEDPSIKDAMVRRQRPRNPRFRKEPVVVDEKSLVRYTRAKPHLRQDAQEEAPDKEVRARTYKELDPAQLLRRAEIERRLIPLRKPNQNSA